jgi:hypothetical protein
LNYELGFFELCGPFKMLDPGTAVAVVALALNVAKDLLEYLKAWKRCLEDVADLRFAALWLWQTFSNVDSMLQRHGREKYGISETQLDEIVGNVTDCKKQVNHLKRELEETQHVALKDKLEKLSNQAKRFKYFFVKGSLKRMLKQHQKLREPHALHYHNVRPVSKPCI